jgi:nicotinamide phosphoribosyltransferase
MRKTSLILRADSYKLSHWKGQPEGMDYYHAYLESRGGLYPTTVFFGLNYYVKEYLSQRVTKEDVEYAAEFAAAHFGSKNLFDKDTWLHLVADHDGFLPLRIRAVPEGTVVPTNNVLMTIESTCSRCAKLIDVETLLMKVWFPTTVATRSREIKKIIHEFLEKTGDPAGIMYKLHDFGYRGTSSEESAMIGGLAHLVNFAGTDTLIALEGGREYYHAQMAGHSVPASQHATATALGEMGEAKQLDRFFRAYKDEPVAAISYVGDSYNIFRFTKEYVGQNLKHDIEKLTDKVFVVRPDSGTPHVIVRQIVEALDGAFGHTVNDKGYKVLNHVRVIQGDGINVEEVRRILSALEERNYSADNVLFGMGGQLLQAMDRDTQRFAIKTSCIGINGVFHDVMKAPITDNGKRSKPGRLKLIEQDGVLTTVQVTEIGHDILQTVWENGKLLVDPTLDEIRERAALTNKSAPVWL